MVWFQCEDCGENLKKPKLSNHFRMCSSSQLSCIDCGVVFNQQNVQAHTQCVSEAEKYGPKGEGASVNMAKTSSKRGEDNYGIDLCVGLSTNAPWTCSLCNVKATSQETLALHSQGKKHKSKAKAASAKASATLGDVPPEHNREGNTAETMKSSMKMQENSEIPRVSNGNGGCNVNEIRGEGKAISKFKESSNAGTGKQDRQLDINGEQVMDFTSRSDNPEMDLKEHGGKGEKKKRKRSAENSYSRGIHTHSSNLDLDAFETSVGFVEDLEKEKVVTKLKGAKSRSKSVHRLNSCDDALCTADKCSKAKQQDGRAARSFKKLSKTILRNDLVSNEEQATKGIQDTVSNSENGVGNIQSFKKKIADVELEHVSPEKFSPSQLVYQKLQDNGNLENPFALSQSLLKAVKWKKLIKKVLKKSPGGTMKKKLLRKSLLPLVKEALQSAGLSLDKHILRIEVDNQIGSSSNAIVDGKLVRLASNTRRE